MPGAASAVAAGVVAVSRGDDAGGVESPFNVTPREATAILPPANVLGLSRAASKRLGERVLRRARRHVPRFRRGKKRRSAEPCIRRASPRGGAAGRRERSASGRARAATFGGWRRSGAQLRHVTLRRQLRIEGSGMVPPRPRGPLVVVRAPPFSASARPRRTSGGRRGPLAGLCGRASTLLEAPAPALSADGPDPRRGVRGRCRERVYGVSRSKFRPK